MIFDEIRERLRRGPPGPEGAPIPPPPSPEELMRIVSKPVIAASAAINEEVRRVMSQSKSGNPVSKEEAIDIVAGTEWAQGWADGMCRMAGLSPGTTEYEQCFDKLTTKVASEVI